MQDLSPPERSADACDCKGRSCGGIPRRDFIRAAGVAAAAAALGKHPLPVMAGPFEDASEYLRIIPEDKRLDAKWVRSLFERGEKETYTDPDALRHIGMPVGGLLAGTLYLGGDGRLWLWEIFNRDQLGIEPREVKYKDQEVTPTGGANFIQPARPLSPLAQGFALRIGDKQWSLDLDGFAHVTFDGRYPIGRVTYRDPDCPVEVTLEAFSPFVPLSLDDSSLPATVMSYRVKNVSDRPVSGELVGHLENAVCLDSGETLAPGQGRRRNRVLRKPGLAALECSVEPTEGPPRPHETRPDILFEDFEKPRYDGWTVEGEAFGDGPVEIKSIPAYQGDVGGEGRRAVNSHATAPGKDARDKDSRLGTLTSKPFTVQRRFIRLLVGGGAHVGKTCVNVLVDGKVVASVTGQNNNRMQPATMHVGRHEGRQAQIQIVDQGEAGWGNIGVDQIVFTDIPPAKRPIQLERDFGTMTLALIGPDAADQASARAITEKQSDESTGSLTDSLVGSVGRAVHLEPGQETTIDFVITWHFPNFYARGVVGRGGSPPRVGNYYGSRFDSALAVARHLAADFDRLAATTRLWVETWYDSTLPYWLLDRTMANTTTLATTTCYRFEDGRFWAWEGIGCCPGTCTHVWHYAQAPGRLFPEIERLERRRVNFGIGMHEDGGIGMRTGLDQSNRPADDGQCGRILGMLREHQMSGDDAFLKSLWPKVKQALEYMIRHDADGKDADGILEGAQPNTLDAAWYGKISFTSSLYLAALRAGEAMAREMDDEPFARRCKAIADRGGRNILQLYNGEYFIQIEDPSHANDIGVGQGCYIDQVFGQTWAHWVGLGRLFDRQKQLSALRALWKYNFVPDVGPFRAHFPEGRWYALAGDAGLLMCTWPKGGKHEGWQKHWQYKYFNECMSGFEWQAAAHMIWEGNDQPDLLQDGLAVARAIHDRYNAVLRNPYNEIECSDHYSRAMASYGAFQAVCGFNCHGPKGHVEFAPRLHPEDFRSAFTGPGAWGTIAQQRSGGAQHNTLTVRWGCLRLKTLAVDVPQGRRVLGATVTLSSPANASPRAVEAKHKLEDSRATITLDADLTLEAGQSVDVEWKLS